MEIILFILGFYAGVALILLCALLVLLKKMENDNYPPMTRDDLIRSLKLSFGWPRIVWLVFCGKTI